MKYRDANIILACLLHIQPVINSHMTRSVVAISIDITCEEFHNWQLIIIE